jgi:hypothetical protein
MHKPEFVTTRLPFFFLKVKKILFAEKRKERPHGVIQQDPETGGPQGFLFEAKALLHNSWLILKSWILNKSSFLNGSKVEPKNFKRKCREK